jgi:hypothetical protein
MDIHYLTQLLRAEKPEQPQWWFCLRVSHEAAGKLVSEMQSFKGLAWDLLQSGSPT